MDDIKKNKIINILLIIFILFLVLIPFLLIYKYKVMDQVKKQDGMILNLEKKYKLQNNKILYYFAYNYLNSDKIFNNNKIDFINNYVEKVKKIENLNILNFKINNDENGLVLFIEGIISTDKFKNLILLLYNLYPATINKLKININKVIYFNFQIFFPVLEETKYKTFYNMFINEKGYTKNVLKKYFEKENEKYYNSIIFDNNVFNYFKIISEKYYKNYEKEKANSILITTEKKQNDISNFKVYKENLFIFIGKMNNNNKIVYILKRKDNGYIVFIDEQNIEKIDANYIFFKMDDMYYKVRVNDK